MFEPISDVKPLHKTMGMPPGDYIRKVMIPKLEKMDLIDWTEPKKLVHWRVIVGKDEELIKKFLLSWYKSEHFPHYWNTFFNKQDPATQKVWVSILNECLENGWYWPKVINDRLTLGSRYKPEEQPQYDEFDRAERVMDDMQNNDPDFPHEE